MQNKIKNNPWKSSSDNGGEAFNNTTAAITNSKNSYIQTKII